MPFDIGPGELIIIVLFGPGRISKVAGELGQAIREFRKGLAGEDKPGAGQDTTHRA